MCGVDGGRTPPGSNYPGAGHAPRGAQSEPVTEPGTPQPYSTRELLSDLCEAGPALDIVEKASGETCGRCGGSGINIGVGPSLIDCRSCKGTGRHLPGAEP
ncbi:MAG: hypothetical protein ACYC6M_03080 [Terriglobales bacterium]